MAEYDIDFAHDMAEVGNTIVSKSPLTDEVSSARAAIYCSLLACEIAMKAGLEAAGVPVAKIRRQSHDLAGLLKCFDDCTVTRLENDKRVSASSIRSIVVHDQYPDATIGKLIESPDVSKYPNEIRYGELLKHFPPDVVSGLANAVVKWVDHHKDDIQTKP